MPDPSLTDAPHPGTVLAARLRALSMSASELSRHLGIPINRVTQIINGQRGVSGDSALRLARFFDTAPRYWIDLQMAYELRRAEEANGDEIRRAVPTLNDVAKSRKPAQASLSFASEAV
ncbi:MAG: HigA family addiction module antitoxin [Hyphomicrobiaceae bacterium]